MLCESDECGKVIAELKQTTLKREKVLGMVDIQTISIVIAATSVVAGAIYYTFQVRHLVKTRQTDLVIRLHANATSKELQEA